MRRTHPRTFVLQGGATTPRPRARRLQSDLTARKHLEQMDYSGLQITGQPYATTGTCVCGVLVGNRPIRRWLRRWASHAPSGITRPHNDEADLDRAQAGWEQVTDEASGHFYYFNIATNESTWEPPLLLTAIQGGLQPNFPVLLVVLRWITPPLSQLKCWWCNPTGGLQGRSAC